MIIKDVKADEKKDTDASNRATYNYFVVVDTPERITGHTLVDVTPTFQSNRTTGERRKDGPCCLSTPGLNRIKRRTVHDG